MYARTVPCSAPAPSARCPELYPALNCTLVPRPVRQSDRATERQSDRATVGHTYRHRDTETQRHSDRATERQSDRDKHTPLSDLVGANAALDLEGLAEGDEGEVEAL
eukprot:2775635-Rhodomonas_salina.1